VLNTTENPPVPFEFVTELRDVEQNLVQPVFVSAFLAVRHPLHPPPPYNGGFLSTSRIRFQPFKSVSVGKANPPVHGTGRPRAAG